MGLLTERIELKISKTDMEKLNKAIKKDGRTKANAIRKGIRFYIDSVFNGD